MDANENRQSNQFSHNAKNTINRSQTTATGNGQPPINYGIINTMLTKNLDSPIELSINEFRQAQRLDHLSKSKRADGSPAIRSILIKNKQNAGSFAATLKKKVTFSPNVICIFYSITA